MQFRFGAPGRMQQGLHRLWIAWSRVRVPPFTLSMVKVAQWVEHVRVFALLVARYLRWPIPKRSRAPAVTRGLVGSSPSGHTIMAEIVQRERDVVREAARLQT